ncbi:hypothetical protein RSOLAG1IB_12677 [Rhizoctonia solani AG-1 IB]|uniref:Uncharacterized protein n=1 Tax=Thanatephorus cucumeris (strain AG1-IB / isolate 7/3/14) TaxID=1108050 RepID=A0A0B7G0L6_THACB|nr:hypothetical protein RSOLAG1IB_12677 [Rhizoctonia solani AG-1 IB]
MTKSEPWVETLRLCESRPCILHQHNHPTYVPAPGAGHYRAHWMWYREVLLSATFPLVAPPVFLNLLIKLNSSLIQRQGHRMLGYPMRNLTRTAAMKGWIVWTERKCLWVIGFKCYQSDIAAWVVSSKYRSSHGLECISGLVPSPVSP